MEVRKIEAKDLSLMLPVYISYYNEQENGCWTEITAGKRIHQVLSMEDSYGLIMKENDATVGFAMGYFKQYDDIKGYTLEEIVIATEYQNKGYGSALLKELEMQVCKQGAACIELQAVSDEHHEHYYGKAGYHNAKNFVMKVKWFE
ncbi:MAG: GNAT family N-acetyltransferase [Lachnospiraceae bacterium]|nr:GNAT family N-acetyltransferase [Lachnospiraceae bacterium]